jgi:transposase
MRYADGGGVSPAGRAKREQTRRQAATLFASAPSPVEVAARLEVSTRSARAWRRAWLTGGEAGLASKGASGPQSKLTVEQLRQLEQLLEVGPAAAGFTEDQRWTLARVAELIAGTFRVRYSLKGVSLLMRRLGCIPQLPIHRAVERDEKEIARWRRRQWPAVKRHRGLDADAATAAAVLLAQSLGDIRTVAAGLEFIARIAARQDEHRRAVELLAAVDALHLRRGVPGLPQTGEPHDELLLRLEDTLGHRRFREAWSAGARADAAELAAQV